MISIITAIIFGDIKNFGWIYVKRPAKRGVPRHRLYKLCGLPASKETSKEKKNQFKNIAVSVENLFTEPGRSPLGRRKISQEAENS